MRVRASALIALAPLLSLPSCSRASSGLPSDPSSPSAPRPELEESPGSVPAPAAALAQGPALPSGGEASRSLVPRLEVDAALVPQLSALRDHFASAPRGPFSVQRVGLANGRTAVLVSHVDESDPIALGFDRDQVDWSKPRPTAGILPPVRQLTITPRPDGGAVLFGWVASLHMVAARMWADDGNPFGDFELFAPDACDALSAAYGPGQGWIAVCTSAQGTHAQRMREDGTIAWTHAGAALGATSASGPATIVFDSGSSFVVLERLAAVGGDRLLAFRYDSDGQPRWPAPVDLGMDLGARSALVTMRVQARVVGEGVVRVERPFGVAGKGAGRATDLTSNGDLRFP